MKKIIIASLVAAQISVVAQPAYAASIEDRPQAMGQGHGAFAGARLRVTLGGETSKPRLGLAVASTQHSESSDGSRSLRFSEGVEFGFAAGRPSLSLAGQPVSALKLAQAEDEEDGGISTLGVVGIVLGGLLVVGGIGLAVLAHEISKNSE